MKVLLDYFKKSGKWYAEGEYETELTPDDSLYEVWDEIVGMFRNGKRPGLVDGVQEFNTLVEVPEHPHNHHHFLMAERLHKYPGTSDGKLCGKTDDGISIYTKEDVGYEQCRERLQEELQEMTYSAENYKKMYCDEIKKRMMVENELDRVLVRVKELEEVNRRSRQLEVNGESAWRWAGDGEDHLESMSNDMAVLIRAEDLRKLANGG